VLMEISVTEQRYQAVLAVLGGVPVTEVASRFGVDRSSVHRWLARYEQAGLEGLADRSHRPECCPHQMAAAVEAQVLEWRRWERALPMELWLDRARAGSDQALTDEAEGELLKVTAGGVGDIAQGSLPGEHR
jgi:transposase-like protein